MEGQTQNKEINPKKRKLIVNLVFWSAVFVLFFVVFGPDLRFGPDFRMSTKIINPDEPGFDPQALKFEDYNDYRDLVHTLGYLFPKGTDKSEIKKFFEKQPYKFQVSEHPAHKQKNMNPEEEKIYSSLSYEFSKLYMQRCFIGLGGNRDTFIFKLDENDKLLFFYLSNGCGLFSPKGDKS